MEHKEIKVTCNTLKVVKEIVDFIYEATVVEGGYKGGWSKYSCRFKKVANILTKRGVILRDGNTVHVAYKWNNTAMAPTPAFYKSVAQEMVMKEREIVARSRNKRKRLEAAAKRAEERKAAKEAAEAARNAAESTEAPKVEGEPISENKVPQKADLSTYSIMELWDELKRRGARIVDGRLKIVTEIELA